MNENTNLDTIIKTIFSEYPPKSPCIYHLDIIDAANDITMSHILINILVKGIKYLWGESTEAKDLSMEQLELVRKYIQSIGFETHLNYSLDSSGSVESYDIHFTPYVENTICYQG